MTKIPLTRGMFALVDDEDAELVLRHRWCAVGKRIRTDGSRDFYASRRNGDTTISMHQLLMPNCDFVDHIDGNGLNNQRSNLRPATLSQTIANQKKRKGSSIYRGVAWDKSKNKWVAYIGSHHNHKKLGTFTSETEAAIAYDRAALDRWGDYANLNFNSAEDRAA